MLASKISENEVVYLNLMQGTASMICLCASVIVVHLLVGEEWLNDTLTFFRLNPKVHEPLQPQVRGL